MSDESFTESRGGREYTRGYTGYKGFNRTKTPASPLLPTIKPQSPDQNGVTFSGNFASNGTPPRTASPDVSVRGGGSAGSPYGTGSTLRTSGGNAMSATGKRSPSPTKPISGYNGTLRHLPDSGIAKPESLGSSGIVSSSINIIAHDHNEAVQASSTSVHALAGYTGYIPRRVGQDLTGKSIWRALEEQQAAPSSAAAASPERSTSPAPAIVTAPPPKPAAIAAVPGYSGYVPHKFRSRDGRFQVSQAPPPAAAVVAHGDPTTPIQRDMHVSGYSGYVPRDWSAAIGKSRWDAVTNNYREPAPDDILASRSIYSSSNARSS